VISTRRETPADCSTWQNGYVLKSQETRAWTPRTWFNWRESPSRRRSLGKRPQQRVETESNSEWLAERSVPFFHKLPKQASEESSCANAERGVPAIRSEAIPGPSYWGERRVDIDRSRNALSGDLSHGCGGGGNPSYCAAFPKLSWVFGRHAELGGGRRQLFYILKGACRPGTLPGFWFSWIRANWGKDQGLGVFLSTGG